MFRSRTGRPRRKSGGWHLRAHDDLALAGARPSAHAPCAALVRTSSHKG
ncbi:Hypothetical protein CAP_3209 [Chondromyces apiculatus DSM 436]|uniref:Uncharacterized protein n=1 Tax=Chondromyces apiculatus DSM 436 TaxID=1192034 RepID=A0A017TA36_9BACT|nr:Hypothetical protein CAP_3209 [Chondromyces apiculatus DSM 436]